MKFLATIASSLFILLFLPQDTKLKDKYKMEYDYNYGLHNGIINFDGDIYTRIQVKGKKNKRKC